MVFKSKKQPENIQNSIFKSLPLTDREIDILACLYAGKSSKKIARILKLSFKTVKAHTYNLMQKLDKHTRENVSEYIEQSDYGEFLRAHYEALLKRYHFDKLRLNLAKTIGSQKKTCCIVCDKRDLFEELRQDLRCFGIKVVTRHSKASSSSYEPTITIVTAIQKDRQAKNGWKPEVRSVIDDGDYYRLFWDVLDTFLTHPSIQETRISFEKMFAEEVSGDLLVDGIKSEQTKIVHKFRLIKNVALIFCLSVIGFGSYKYYLSGNTLFSVHYDFPVPVESQALIRKDIFKKIDVLFQGSQKIKVVALVGLGGAGKTTIARQYAKQQKDSVIWEVNAESQTALLNSFTQLAYELSETLEQKTELERIQKMENQQEVIKKFMSFVRKKLKSKKSWFLVFDNVENMIEIQPFFPHHDQAWGNGKVLITTRNDNIKENTFIDPHHVIDIHPLNDDEKLRLFSKIMKTKGDLAPL